MHFKSIGIREWQFGIESNCDFIPNSIIIGQIDSDWTQRVRSSIVWYSPEIKRWIRSHFNDFGRKQRILGFVFIYVFGIVGDEMNSHRPACAHVIRIFHLSFYFQVLVMRNCQSAWILVTHKCQNRIILCYLVGVITIQSQWMNSHTPGILLRASLADTLHASSKNKWPIHLKMISCAVLIIVFCQHCNVHSVTIFKVLVLSYASRRFLLSSG